MPDDNPKTPAHVIHAEEEIHCFLEGPENTETARPPHLPLLPEDVLRDPVPLFTDLFAAIIRPAEDSGTHFLVHHDGSNHRFLYATLTPPGFEKFWQLRLHAVRPSRAITLTPFGLDDYLVSGWSPPTYICAERTGFASLELTHGRWFGEARGFDLLPALICYFDAWLLESSRPLVAAIDIVGDDFLSAQLSAESPDGLSQLLLDVRHGERDPMPIYVVE